jgi:hypothetical protein
MEQRTGLKAQRGSEFTSKLLFFIRSLACMFFVQSWLGAIVASGSEVSKRSLMRDVRI